MNWFKETWWLVKQLFTTTKNKDKVQYKHMDHYPFSGYSAMSWCGYILTKKKESDIKTTTWNHENIHQTTSERPITNFDPKGDPYNPTYGYNPGAGYVSNSDPLGSLYVEGALLNPVFKLAGNAVSNIARGLTKYSSKYVPEVRRTVQDKINSLFRREAEDKARTYKLYDDAIESRNRIIEDLYSNPAYMERARQIQNTYGDDYAKVYEDIINQYNTNYWNLPNPVIKQLDAKAKMQAKDAAVNRYITRRQPAGYDDFEYQINRNLTEIDYPTTRHELGHYVDFNLAKSSNPDYSNSMFAELKEIYQNRRIRYFQIKLIIIVKVQNRSLI